MRTRERPTDRLSGSDIQFHMVAIYHAYYKFLPRASDVAGYARYRCNATQNGDHFAERVRMVRQYPSWGKSSGACAKADCAASS